MEYGRGLHLFVNAFVNVAVVTGIWTANNLTVIALCALMEHVFRHQLYRMPYLAG